MTTRTTLDILNDTQRTLRTAQFGLEDLEGSNPEKRMPGLFNLVVFGRAVTNVLQNLRSTVGKATFDEWYTPFQNEMSNDELLKYFYQLRSEILKEGSVRTQNSVHIKKLDSSDLAPLLANPLQGVKGFFVGDRLGGSGWELELSDGTVVHYYVQLPENVQSNITTNFHFMNPPQDHAGETLTDTSVETLASHYIAYLEGLVSKAVAPFGR